MLTIRRATAEGIEVVDRNSLSDLLRRPDIDLWLHLDGPTEEDLQLLHKEFNVHQLTLEDIVSQNQRPKIEPFENYVYIAMHPLMQKDRTRIEPAELDLVLGRKWLVSSNSGALPGVIDGECGHERIVNALRSGADFLLYTIVDLVVDNYFPIIDDIGDEIEDLEERLLSRARPEDISRLLTLKRSLVHIRRAVGPQREIFNQLTRHDFPFVRPDYNVYFRDVYDHLIRITEELDSLRDLLSAALEIHLASMSNQLNATMKRLAAWGTILVAITAIAGIYGMNFKFMPELEWRYGYFAVIGSMLLLAVGLYFFFKRKDYL